MANTFILGGASADELNAGTLTAGGSATWPNSQGADGVALFTDDAITAAEITDNGTTVTITRGGIGSGILVDHWAYVDWVDGTFADGRYRVSARAAGSVTIDFGGDAGNKPTLDTTKLRIGGAVKQGAADDITHIQALFDAAVAGDSLKIQADLSFGATLDVNQNSGTEADRIIVEGVSPSTGNRLAVTDTWPVITTSVSLVNGLIAPVGTTYWEWYQFDCNGGGAGKADYGMNGNSATADNHGFFNCKFHNCDLNGLRWLGDFSVLANCEVYDNRATGGVLWQSERGGILGLHTHDNIGYGLSVADSANTVEYVVAADNSTDGIVVGATADAGTVCNCTAVGNGGDGFVINSSADLMRIYNNVSCNNTGNGYNLNADIGHLLFFGNNHASGNSAESDLGGTWADVGHGGNTNDDPDFADATNNVYTIGNADILQSGVLDSRGVATLIGAQAIELTGVLNRLRTRYSDAVHGYKLE